MARDPVGDVITSFDGQFGQGWKWFRYDGPWRRPFHKSKWREGSRYYATSEAAQAAGEKAKTRREAKRVN